MSYHIALIQWVATHLHWPFCWPWTSTFFDLWLAVLLSWSYRVLETPLFLPLKHHSLSLAFLYLCACVRSWVIAVECLGLAHYRIEVMKMRPYKNANGAPAAKRILCIFSLNIAVDDNDFLLHLQWSENIFQIKLNCNRAMHVQYSFRHVNLLANCLLI